jgi:hypothetical protein
MDVGIGGACRLAERIEAAIGDVAVTVDAVDRGAKLDVIGVRIEGICVGVRLGLPGRPDRRRCNGTIHQKRDHQKRFTEKRFKEDCSYAICGHPSTPARGRPRGINNAVARFSALKIGKDWRMMETSAAKRAIRAVHNLST